MESLCAILRGREGDTLVVVEENFVHFVTDDRAMLSVRRVEGQFPRYRDVIPHFEKNSPRLILDRKATIAALRRLPVCQETRRVALTPAEGGTALRLDGDNASTTIRAVTAKLPAGLRFDARLFMETLDCSDDDFATLLVRDAENPTCLDFRNVTAVLMPLVGGFGAPAEVSAEERGAASLEDALKLDDPDPAAFFGQAAKPARVGRPKKQKAVWPKEVSFIDAMHWVNYAPDEEIAHVLRQCKAVQRQRKARVGDVAVA